MKFEWHELSIVNMKDKYVVMLNHHQLFGLFKHTSGVRPDFSQEMALECTADYVYNSCGVSKKEAEIILLGYKEYLTLCGNYVKVN